MTDTPAPADAPAPPDAKALRKAERQRKLQALSQAHYEWTQRMAKTRDDLWDPDHEDKWGPDYPTSHLDVEASAADADFWDEAQRILDEGSPSEAAPPTPPEGKEEVGAKPLTSEESVRKPAPATREPFANPAAARPRSSR